MDADDAVMMPVLDRMRCPVVAPLYFLFLAAVAATSYSIHRKGTVDLPFKIFDIFSSSAWR